MICVYTYIYIYIYIYIYYLCRNMWLYIYIYTHTYIHTYMCIHIYIYIYNDFTIIIISVRVISKWGPCKPAAEAALRPLIWHSASMSYRTCLLLRVKVFLSKAPVSRSCGDLTNVAFTRRGKNLPGIDGMCCLKLLFACLTSCLVLVCHVWWMPCWVRSVLMILTRKNNNLRVSNPRTIASVHFEAQISQGLGPLFQYWALRIK